jgi:hypothetical protein
MVAPEAGWLPRRHVGRPRRVGQAGGTAFPWSHAKIRILCLFLFAAAMAAIAGVAVPIPCVQWLCLAWLVGVALLMHRLDQRASPTFSTGRGYRLFLASALAKLESDQGRGRLQRL